MKKLCVVEIEDTGVLLDGGNEMSLGDAMYMAKLYTDKNPSTRVRILQGAERKPVQKWRDGHRL